MNVENKLMPKLNHEINLFTIMLRTCGIWFSLLTRRNATVTTYKKCLCAGYKSQYNIEQLYPGSNLKFNLQPLQKVIL